MKSNSFSIHLVGVGGVGMGTLATALKRSGHVVSGSDATLYDPMKSVLESEKIQLVQGYLAETATKLNPDLVVIGNVVRKDNPEVGAWLKKGTEFISFPEAVRRFVIGDRSSIVVAGTHGKTTTTTWISYLLEELGLKPSYLIGGVPVDLKQGCVISEGDLFVGEGDEYDSAFFDKGPKFLHYNPRMVVLTSIEFDHADIYRDIHHVRESFEKLIALLPGDGLCVARYDDPLVMQVISDSLCPVQTFGLERGAMWRLGKVEEGPDGFQFEVMYKNRSAGTFKTSLFGEHNLMNIISGIIVAVNLGISFDRLPPIVEKFKGVRRRQEILKNDEMVVIDDFAHHPTEVKATLRRYGGDSPAGKIWAVFEPRSATARRDVHQKLYGEAFEAADEVIIAGVFHRKDVAQPLSESDLIDTLHKAGKRAETFGTTDEILERLRAETRKDDVIVFMSNGGFDNIQRRFVQNS